ncbi:MAG: response regulator transcription factor [Bacteroidia bacterium]|nr:response regulator transcription factor [Bacteroidia bacterium]RZV66348.1 MAG: response regulator transcription factor [Flavobacteriaceae bacterium]
MKILIVDDHAILRKGLIEILRDHYKDAEFIEAANGIEALSILRKENLDVAVLDISMPELNGIEVLKQSKALDIKTPILILSMQDEGQYALRVLRAGAFGFLNKDSAPTELITAINKVLSGKKYISESIADILAESATSRAVDDQHELLSDRELQVLIQLGQGKSVSEIGKEIGLSVNTVSTYRSRILQKLKLSNNAAIIRYAIDHNLV